MRTFLSFLLAFFIINSGRSQTSGKFWVQFKDKDNSPYSISNPSQYLSVKAIQRRTNQNLPVDITDLPVNPSYVQGVLATGVSWAGASKWLNGLIVSTADTSLMAQVRALPYVSGTSQVFREAKPGDIGTDKFKDHFLQTERSMLSNEINTLNYGNSYNQISMIAGDYLHNLGYMGQGMTIAIIDAGFPNVPNLAAFDSLFTNNQILGGWDFVSNSNVFYDDNSHGTAVLSHIGGYVDNELVGTAPKANFWLLRSEDAAPENIIEEYFWACAAEFADSVGADIISSSLGYTKFDKSYMDHDYATDMNGDKNPSTRAADYAASKGILVCVSAGNEGAGPWAYIGSPADADSVITVGAVSPSRTITSFSSRGPSADGRIKPTVCTQGQNTYYASQGGAIVGGGNGTSFSCPILAGAAACLWQTNPSKTNMEILEIIKQSADRYNNPDTAYGYGIPNFSVANALLNGYKLDDIKNEDLRVYPVPTNDNVNIAFFSPDSQTIQIRIFDLSGKIVFSRQEYITAHSFNKLTFPEVSNLSKGAYVITIHSSRGITSKRMIKA